MGVEEFVHETRPQRVVFGVGSLARLGGELERLDVHRLLVLSTPGRRALADEIGRLLGGRLAGVFDRAAMHVPLELAARARACAADVGSDALLAVGGGSTIGLAKAIALETRVPIVAVPTTYSGSEMTPIWGLTDGGRKRTGTDFGVLPRLVLYEPKLTLALSPEVSATSGLNALAHAAEGLYARDATPISSLLAEAAIRALAEGLPRVRHAPADLDARRRALEGAWLAGATLGSVGMALHHKLCHTLGGSFGLAHAPTHAVVLPHAIAYNAPAAPQAMQRIAAALGAADAAAGTVALARAIAAPTSLRELGLRESQLDEAARIAASNPYWNPRPVARDALRALLQDAWEGAAPGTRTA